MKGNRLSYKIIKCQFLIGWAVAINFLNYSTVFFHFYCIYFTSGIYPILLYHFETLSNYFNTDYI